MNTYLSLSAVIPLMSTLVASLPHPIAFPALHSRQGGTGQCKNITGQHFTVGQNKIDWGNALPGDVIGLLNSPGAPCADTSGGSCLDTPWKQLPTTIVVPGGQKGTEEVKFEITVKDSEFAPDLAPYLLGAIKQAYSANVDSKPATYTNNKPTALTGKNGVNHPDGTSTTVNENWQFDTIKGTLYEDDAPCAWMEVEVKLPDMSTGDNACSIGSKVLAALPALLGLIDPLLPEELRGITAVAGGTFVGNLATCTAGLSAGS